MTMSSPFRRRLGRRGALSAWEGEDCENDDVLPLVGGGGREAVGGGPYGNTFKTPSWPPSSAIFRGVPHGESAVWSAPASSSAATSSA